MHTKREYHAIHKWVRKTYGKPSLCEHCGTTEAKRFEWAAKDHVLGGKRREDWLRLCATCHKRYDGIADKVRASRTGKTTSEATKAKISATLTANPYSHWTGKNLSETHKQAIAKTLTGQKRGHYTAEHRLKIGKAMRGKTHTEETKSRMRESQRRRREQEGKDAE